MSKTASNAALKKFEERFAKTFGAGSLRRSAEVNPYEVVSTGSLTLDYRLGVGGYVEGRLVEIWGPDGVGKTTLSLFGLAEAQRKHKGKMVAFIDMEQKFDKAWAIAHGVDLERLYLYTPESAEDVADALKEMLMSGMISMVVVDSIGAMIPEAEKEKDADAAVMAAQAKIVTRMVKIAAVEARKTGTVVLLLNQVRANLSYGADTTTGGGFALKHVTTMKLKMRRTGTPPYKVKIGGEDRVVGHEVSILVERNGVAPAYRTAIISLLHVSTDKYGPLGIDTADEATTLGIDTKVIAQGGAWYTLPGGDRHNGRDKVVDALRSDIKMLDAVRTAVLASVVGEVTEEVQPEDIEDGSPKFRKGAQEDA
jgi:recombination protein RecA